MYAAILCPGPSLATTCPSADGLRAFDVTLGVNRAPLLRSALMSTIDWWVAGDWPVLWNNPIVPVSGYCTMADAARLATTKTFYRLNLGARWVTWEELPVRPRYSTLAALSLAAHLGCTHVDMFGDDKAGNLDFDNTKQGADRQASRWASEIAMQDQMIAKLGITVRQVRP